MLKKSAFFDFLNRRDGVDFERFMADATEEEHYINWNEFVLAHDYGDAESEYRAIRNSCAIFDVSPLRKTRIHGSGSGPFFDRLLTRPVHDLPALRATYAVFCNEDGSLKDDAIIYKTSDDDYLLMPSDIDHRPYFESLCQQFDLREVSFEECTDSWVGLAIQGPQSAAVLLSMGFSGAEQLEPFEFRDYETDDGVMRVARLGFTADLGYECWVPPGLADGVMRRIESARSALNIAIPGYGLSALQACRLEGGFIVAGWDCSTELEPTPGFERSPYELGLDWLVDLDSSPFVGREALLRQKENGHRYTLRSFEIDTQGLPSDGATLRDSAAADAAEVGIVNCSTWSWGMGEVIGNASVLSEHADLESAWVEIDGRQFEAKLTRGPLLTLARRYQVPAPVGA